MPKDGFIIAKDNTRLFGDPIEKIFFMEIVEYSFIRILNKIYTISFD